MKKPYRRLLRYAALICALAVPLTSHAWFFFFIPLGLFTPNDKKTVQELEQKQDWKGMLDLAETRLKTDEKNAGWLYLNGLALQRLQRCDEAIPKYQNALEVKTDYKDAQLNSGICHLELGHYDQALSLFTDLIGKAPEMWQPYYNAGLAYVRKQDPVNARVYLEQLKSRNMVWASTLEDKHIKPLEFREEQYRQAVAAREKEEQERVERERIAKKEADANAEEDERQRVVGSQAVQAKSLEERLKDLKQLHAKGLISKEVYETGQRELLNLR